MSKNYSNESIRALKGADRVRLRPGVIFGSDGIEGCIQSFFEILSNSIDEAREGYGNVIDVIRHKDKSITVIDRGRGIPLDYNNKEGRFNWELVFCELYAGGKYKNNEGENYEYSLGLNGLGAASTQFASEYMDVEVIRDGYKYVLHFEKGNNVGGLEKTKVKTKETGTKIKWKPDLEVFTDIDIPLETYKEVLKRQAVVNRGLKFEFYDEESGTHETYLYENGIEDYVKEIIGEKGLTGVQYYEMEEIKGKDREDKAEYKVKAEIAFAFSNENTRIEYYHNSSYLEYGGSPDKALKSAFLSVIDKYLRENGKYNKNEKKITFQDIEDSLVFISNSFSTVTSYENQTKKAITNKFIQQAMTEFIRERLEVYFIENRIEAEKVAGQILVNKRSREKAERTRIDIKKKLANDISITNKVKKFVDCRTKDKDLRELYIVEGDSALGSTKLGRDSEFQAIMPIRGKILNCLKADVKRIFDSEIIVDLLKVLGCGVELSSKQNKELSNFDLEKLNWNKIIICTDADVDGYQIRTLVLAMIYRLVPTLLREKLVYIAESPLYEIIDKDEKSHFAYSDSERDAIMKKLKSGFKVQRSKGLGENEPEMMWETTMNPATRRLIRVTMEDAEKANEYFELFLGNNVDRRREFIAEHGHKYIDVTDLD